MGANTETPEYAEALRRQLRAYAKRIEWADEVDLATAVEILTEFEDLLGEAATKMSQRTGWAYIGHGLGISAQGARQKFYVRRMTRKKKAG